MAEGRLCDGSRDRGGVARVRVERGRLGEFLALLGEVGETTDEKTPLPSGGGGAVDVTITVETGRRTDG